MKKWHVDSLKFAIPGLGRLFMVLFGIFGACVTTSLNAIQYVELLGSDLHPLMLLCYPHGIGVFQQDNCTSHKSRLATAWLHQYFSDFSVINWQPISADLNPIEHICGTRHPTAPASITKLRTALANIWN
ncbi:transposable element Tcb2 transposase [Trichonephila clavipes]|nr:transposable element Tcb2 transposase [Trichonephila clavipes]